MPFDMDISWIQYPARRQRAGVLGLFFNYVHPANSVP